MYYFAPSSGKGQVRISNSRTATPHSPSAILLTSFKMAPKKDTKQSSKTPAKTPKKKEGGGGAKAKKKKWSKGKVRDKLNNLVIFDQATYDKLLKEVPSYKLITPSVVSERLKIRGSLARKALDELQEKGLIRRIIKHRSQQIYTRTTKTEEAAEAAEAAAAATASEKEKKK